MKENYPVEMAEYANGNNIRDEPAFQWWVPYTLKKRDGIIASTKARLRNTRIKYGVKVPRHIREAKLFDQENGNTAWQDAIDLEMATIMPALDLIDGNRPPPGYSKSSGHLTFDVKMEFTLKD